MKYSQKEHRLLAQWAAGCAEQVLPLFEERHPADPRPRQAIAAAREWAEGKIPVQEARRHAFAAHAAAREAATPSARAAARAAGHAAATAHAPGHARHASAYARKAAPESGAATANQPPWSPPLPGHKGRDTAPEPSSRLAGTDGRTVKEPAPAVNVKKRIS